MKLAKVTKSVLLSVFLIYYAGILYSQQIAFPGTEGYGKYSVGGRGGKVYEVTTLSSSGPGSLGEAIGASGPGTNSGVRDRIAEPSAGGSWYVADNVMVGSSEVTNDNWKGVDGSGFTKLTEPWDAAMPINQQTAEEAYQTVLDHAGCSFPNRDLVDARIIEEVRNGTFTYGTNDFINIPSDVGGWPTLDTGTPSGKTFVFPGFYDGDGNGGVDYQNGNVWKLRFMPNEFGNWSYEYSWSDTTTGGSGTINCVADGAGKGVLQAYEGNPHWLAYNGRDPVWLKSYYETGHGAIGQDFDWIVNNVYLRLVNAGYNHLQVNWLLSLCCFHQYYLDGPEPEITDMTLYQNGEPYTTMNFDIWRRMEQHLGWLNDHDVGVHMFLGVEGGKNGGPAWDALSSGEKDWFVEYMVARLAPYANLAGWNFVWEVPGDREDWELGFARLIQKYDIFNHLRTYQDEKPEDNEYDNSAYNFAAVENHGYSEKSEWGRAWTHHKGALDGYVSGKPVFMSEGNALWRRFWHTRINERYGTVDQNDLRQSAWACATAGASFTWCGHTQDNGLYAYGPDGFPFSEENEFLESEKHICIFTGVMNEEVVFYKMNPRDDLLARHDSLKVWALAEMGKQYLVFSTLGESFCLLLSEGNYVNNLWLDAKTGAKTQIEDYNITINLTDVSFVPPDNNTDWVLILRTGDITAVDEGSSTQNTDTDQSPRDFILCQNFPNPFNSQTTIQYELLKSNFVALTIHDIKGQEIAVLENGFKHAGRHKVFWNMEGAVSGIYIYTLKVGNAVKVRKLIALK